jgi:hypothetical protein
MKSYEIEATGYDLSLSDPEIRHFTQMVVWAAADFCYGDDFRLKAEFYESTGKKELFESEDPHEDKKIRLHFNAIKTGFTDDRGSTSPNYLANISIGISKTRLSNIFEQDGQEGDVWLFQDFQFSWPGDSYYCDVYYDYHDADGEPIEDLSEFNTDVLERLNQNKEGQYDIFRKTDCLEMYNILLALGVPGERMGYYNWEASRNNVVSLKTRDR